MGAVYPWQNMQCFPVGTGQSTMKYLLKVISHKCKENCLHWTVRAQSILTAHPQNCHILKQWQTYLRITVGQININVPRGAQGATVQRRNAYLNLTFKAESCTVQVVLTWRTVIFQNVTTTSHVACSTASRTGKSSAFLFMDKRFFPDKTQLLLRPFSAPQNQATKFDTPQLSLQIFATVWKIFVQSVFVLSQHFLAFLSARSIWSALKGIALTSLSHLVLSLSLPCHLKSEWWTIAWIIFSCLQLQACVWWCLALPIWWGWNSVWTKYLFWIVSLQQEEFQQMHPFHVNLWWNSGLSTNGRWIHVWFASALPQIMYMLFVCSIMSQNTHFNRILPCNQKLLLVHVEEFPADRSQWKHCKNAESNHLAHNFCLARFKPINDLLEVICELSNSGENRLPFKPGIFTDWILLQWISQSERFDNERQQDQHDAEQSFFRFVKISKTGLVTQLHHNIGKYGTQRLGNRLSELFSKQSGTNWFSNYPQPQNPTHWNSRLQNVLPFESQEHSLHSKANLATELWGYAAFTSNQSDNICRNCLSGIFEHFCHWQKFLWLPSRNNLKGLCTQCPLHEL